MLELYAIMLKSCCVLYVPIPKSQDFYEKLSDIGI